MQYVSGPAHRKTSMPALVSLLLSVIIAFCFSLPLVTAIPDLRSETKITDSPTIGGPHGKFFQDFTLVGGHHKRISNIKIGGACAGKVCRVFSLALQYRNNRDDYSTLETATHGNPLEAKTILELALKKDEYVQVVELSTFKHRVGKIWQRTQWTRIGWIRMTTNKLNQIEYGSHEFGDKYSTLTEGALLYFSGRAGDMVDELTAHWISSDHF